MNEKKEKLIAAGFKASPHIEVKIGKKSFPASFVETQLIHDVVVDVYELQKPTPTPRAAKQVKPAKK